MAKTPPPDHFYKGTRMPALAPASTLDAVGVMEVRDDDIWVVSYPKAGTTWGQEVTSVIMEGGDLAKVKSKRLSERVPYLELGPLGQQSASYKRIDAMSYDVPRLIRTHLPYELMPQQWHTKKPKTLYVARNPKDTAVSCWHFTKINHFFGTRETFADFLKKFVEGDVAYGSWFDHNLAFWEHRHDPNILFVKYEDVKTDHRRMVKRIAEFYDRPLPVEMIDACVEHCTLDGTKDNRMSNHLGALYISQEKGTFHRKGEVGDWMSYFTIAQNDVLDSLYEEKMMGTGLTFDFEL
ncbi:sulfotransferase 1B1-like [Ptychodera flava]|uniref:sulfotransferase 1B1-like n=1 Tax=Ptychodera flava TaxID=63121 RepID=UPI00396A2677